MILVTGANGQTGRAIIKRLLERGEEIRAFVHHKEQQQELLKIGVKGIIVGDMLNEDDVDRAYTEVDTVYHICSVFNPKEVEIGKIAIKVAKEKEIKHFIYHSVLHSILHNMPHHKKKHIVEELIVNSGIPYTIVQPSAFMQNIMESWNSLRIQGIFRQKLFTSNKTRMCMIDLDDLAEAVANIITNDKHIGATYELCGDNLSLCDMIEIFSRQLGKEITVDIPDDKHVEVNLKKAGFSDYYISSLITMFHHYNKQGFIGNCNTLTWLLGRNPHNFEDFIRSIKQNY